jgi:hypothetical protein
VRARSCSARRPGAPAFNPGEFGLTGSYISQRHNPGDHVIGEVNNGIACDDDATGRGFIMYSEDSEVHDRFADFPPHGDNADHFLCVVYARGQWMYDDNEGV